MDESVPGFLGILHMPDLSAAGKFAGVADLPAHLGVERGDVQDDRGAILNLHHLAYLGICMQMIIPNKSRGDRSFDMRDGDDFTFLGRASASALLFHESLETSAVHG